MLKTDKLAVALGALSMDRIEELANTLVFMDECQAERLKNAITVAQQEYDNQCLEQEKQYEMASRIADQDCEYYGERI
jgi:hypothetical protein